MSRVRDRPQRGCEPEEMLGMAGPENVQPVTVMERRRGRDVGAEGMLMGGSACRCLRKMTVNLKELAGHQRLGTLSKAKTIRFESDSHDFAPTASGKSRASAGRNWL